MNDKLPILAHGERYIDRVEKHQGAGPKTYPREYREAKSRVISDLDVLSEDLRENPKMFMPEKVICIRMEPKFEAKSYSPDPVVYAVRDKMEIIGGRKYTYDIKGNEEKKAKLYYVRTRAEGIDELKTILSTGVKDSQARWQHSIQSIRTIDLMNAKEKIMGFDDDWREGFVEFVLHPLGKDNTRETVAHFLLLSGLKEENVSVREYEGGLTFIGARTSRDNIDAVADFNPLRSVHPIYDYDDDVLRIISADGPKPPVNKTPGKIVVGVFDSGVDTTLPYFSGYVDNTDLVANARKNYSHGSFVTGALLYGNMRGKDSASVLNSPDAFVKMFRVIPEDRTSYSNNPEGKLGLYETIDHIEQTVRMHPEIKLYNLSIGPHMPIIDDEINRFTYALDKLTFDVGKDGENPLFTIACGNDGEKTFNRIQPPSDMVNGLGIGAYTFNSLNEVSRAKYSCIGPGREGAKVKPDVLEFGGSTEYPFISTAAEAGKIVALAGTSFAAPLAMHKIAGLMAESDEISPHLARTILIQNAVLPKGTVRNDEEGYGYSIKEPGEMLKCDSNIVTILYEGELEPSMTAKLPIYSPGINMSKGNVLITWTITAVVNPDINDVDSYTCSGIEDTFYPNSKKFTYRKKGKKSEHINELEEDSQKRIKKLSDEGYTCSLLPDSKPAKTYRGENELRNNDLKWDTVIKKTITMRSKSLYMPFLTIHAMSRNGNTDPVHYFMAVTIEALGYNGSLYDEILRTYPQLEQIRMRNVNRVRV